MVFVSAVVAVINRRRHNRGVVVVVELVDAEVVSHEKVKSAKVAFALPSAEVVLSPAVKTRLEVTIANSKRVPTIYETI